MGCWCARRRASFTRGCLWITWRKTSNTRNYEGKTFRDVVFSASVYTRDARVAELEADAEWQDKCVMLPAFDL